MHKQFIYAKLGQASEIKKNTLFAWMTLTFVRF